MKLTEITYINGPKVNCVEYTDKVPGDQSSYFLPGLRLIYHIKQVNDKLVAELNDADLNFYRGFRLGLVESYRLLEDSILKMTPDVNLNNIRRVI